jgi:cytochrome P450
MPADTPVESQRKVDRGEMAPGCPAHVDAHGVWHDRMRLPVIYRDGADHREHRRQTAKYFTPRRVDNAYRGLMDRLAEEQCEELRRRGEEDLSKLTFRLAVAVASEVIGLTDGYSGMASRLERFFDHIPDGPPGRSPKAWYAQIKNSVAMGSFYWFDVRPSIATRRKQRRDDLISHLIDEGRGNNEILGECATFGAAGMITTREFITVVAWHLFTDDELRTAYVGGDEKQRVAVLHEILRLEPVVANLARTTTADHQIGDVTIPAGAKVDIGVAAVNLDPDAVGADPGAICPARPLADGVGDAGLSFGDGAHRCPGGYIAIQETDMFLTKLFAMPGLRMVQEPTVRVRPIIAGYQLTGLRIAIS